MKKYLDDTKISRWLFIICWFAYTSTMLGKNSYPAAMVAIIIDGLVSKTNASLIVSLFYLCYGIGQLISGALGDRISSFIMITIGLSVTAFAIIELASILSGSHKPMKMRTLIISMIVGVFFFCH